MAPPVPEILSVSERASPGNTAAPRINGTIHATEKLGIFAPFIMHPSAPRSGNAPANVSFLAYRQVLAIS